ncbi:MAG: EF-hand domain-containing protein [archaeon]|nr:EF-hand domain-containing protein [archaeon]
MQSRRRGRRGRETKTPPKIDGLNISPQQLSNYKESFDLMDTNESGEISINDVINYMKETGNEMPKDEILRLIENLDKDKDDTLNFEEFCQFCVLAEKEEKEYRSSIHSKKPLSSHRSRHSEAGEEGETEFEQEEKVIDAFKHFDKKKKGKISVEDFRYILEDMGFELSPEFVDELFENTNLDENGEFDYREFVTSLRRINTANIDEHSAIAYAKNKGRKNYTVI